MYSAKEDQAIFEAQNNVIPPEQVYIVMSSPCSKDLPSNCAAARALAAQDAEESGETILAKRATEFEATNNDGKHKKHHHHGHHHHGKHHHGKHHHGKKHGHGHGHRHHHKNKHPYQNLCVAVGDFCGSKLYGCDFDPKTHYRCSAIGEPPATVLVDAKICGGTNEPGECTCPGDGKGPVCGSQLPAACKADETKIYHCPNGPKTKPEVLKKCRPGTVCINTDSGPTCGFDSCDCDGGKRYCSGQFPDRCGLKKNTVVKCIGGKLTETEVCSDTQECVHVADGAFCANRDCKCPDDGTVCGEIFPPSCRLPATSLYTCKKGEPPTVEKDCLPGYCAASVSSISAAAVFEALAKDVCIGECTCANTGLVCGFTFAKSCKLDSTTLYECSGSGSTPKPSKKCDHTCAVQAGSNACTNGDCTCPGTGDDLVCGHDLPASCAANPNTIYICRGGKGTKPEPLSECKPGTVCIKKPSPEGAACGSGTCDCKGDNEVCSSQFLDECGLERNSIYKCTPGGKPEKVEECTAPDTCKVHTDGPKCTPEECVCKDGGKHCGVTYDANCKLTANTLYSCAPGDVPKEEKDCNPGVCSSNNKPAIKETAPATGSEFSATADGDDFCIDQCACKFANEDLCSSTYNPACKYKANTLMHCDAINSKPTEKETCASECTVKDGNDECKTDPCACRKNGNTCGNTFPPKCNFEDNSLYTCTGNRTTPTKKKACDPLSICTPVAGGNDVCGASNDCECISKTPTCGNKFPPGCNYKPDDLVMCLNHTTITTCPEGCADGECKTGCKCSTDVAVCGSSFADKCDLIPNAVYNCKKGATPVLAEDCGDKLCIKGVDPTAAPADNKTTPDPTGFMEADAVEPAKCGDPCTCKDNQKTCGSAFAESCKLEPTALYGCTAPGATPTKLQNCTSGCEYTQPENSCKHDCSPQVKNMSKQIDLIIEQMEILMETYTVNISGQSSLFNPAGNVTLYAYPPFIKTLDKIKTDMMKDAEKPEKLSLQAGTVKKTIIGAGRIMVSIKSLFPTQNVNVTLPLIQDMRDLIPLIDSVLECTGGNKSDCSGITKLWKDFNDQTVEYLTELAETAGPANLTIKNMSQQINNVTMIIDDVFKNRNDSTLPEAGKLLNGIIGVITANGKVYKEAAIPVNMYFEAAKEALRCEAFNITMFADKCSAYGDRLQGGIANVIEWIQKALNNTPLIGPIFTTPILNALKQAVITLQNRGGEAVGRVIGILVGVINMFGLLKNADNTGESQTDDILAFLGIADVAGDCGGKKSRCMGAIEIAKILLHTMVDYIIDNILLGIGTALSFVINGVVDAISEGLNAVTSAGIGIVIAALKGATTIINFAFRDLFKDVLNTAKTLTLF